MSSLIKVSDFKELIFEYEKENLTIEELLEALEKRFLEKIKVRGREHWGELEAECNDSDMSPFQWLELYYHPPIRK